MKNQMNASQLCLFTLLAIVVKSSGADSAATKDDVAPPNIVIIFIHDLGYGDINSFSDNPYATPNLDRMAREGRKFTDFVVSSAVCSASARR